MPRVEATIRRIETASLRLDISQQGSDAPLGLKSWRTSTRESLSTCVECREPMSTRGAEMAQHVCNRRGDHSFATDQLLTEAAKPTIEDDVCVRRIGTYLLGTLSLTQDASSATRNSECASSIVMSIVTGAER